MRPNANNKWPASGQHFQAGRQAEGVQQATRMARRRRTSCNRKRETVIGESGSSFGPLDECCLEARSCRSELPVWAQIGSGSSARQTATRKLATKPASGRVHHFRAALLAALSLVAMLADFGQNLGK